MGLGSGIRDPENLFRIPDPGVKKAQDPGQRYGSGSFYHKATLVRKNCFVTSV
jgi:hypothetical protein